MGEVDLWVEKHSRCQQSDSDRDRGELNRLGRVLLDDERRGSRLAVLNRCRGAIRVTLPITTGLTQSLRAWAWRLTLNRPGPGPSWLTLVDHLDEISMCGADHADIGVNGCATA